MKIRERFFIYQATIPTVPVGGLNDLSIRMDSDAPFMLRRWKTRNLGPSGIRFQNASRQWASGDFQTDLIAPQTPAGVWLPSRWAVVQEQMYYPVSSQLVFSVANNTNADLTNVRVLFRGSKMYDEHAIASPTYPSRMSVLPFIYQLRIPNVATTAVINDQPFNVRTDSDFVLNYGVADPFDIANPDQVEPAGTYEEVYVQLRDESRRAYANEPVHINDMFGQGMPTSYPFFSSPTTNSVNDPAVMQFPNRFTPPIYIPRNGAHYLDVIRNEVQAGMNAVNLYFRFHGVKVFAR